MWPSFQGQWTDDASMGVCLADSVLKCRQEGNASLIDGSDLRSRFHAWWFHGYGSAFPNSGKDRR